MTNMDAKTIVSAFEGVSDEWRELAVRQSRAELTRALAGVAARQADAARLCPAPELMFNALRLCPADGLRVVLLGQDPYPKRENAMGLSFAAPRGRAVPASLRNIYECLRHCDLIAAVPSHGDLTAWARQGVLMLNAALTTEVGRSNAHADVWEPYTDKLISLLNSTRTV